MDGECNFSEQLTVGSNVMEESLIEMFGCADFNEKVIRISISNDQNRYQEMPVLGMR